MATEIREQTPSGEGIFEDAARNTLALNPLVGIRGQDLVDSAGILFKAIVNEPKVATEQWLSFLGELGSIVAGKSERAPQAGDKRFSDPTWKESALHSGLLKAYLAWGDAVSGFVDKTQPQRHRQGAGASDHGHPDRCGRADQCHADQSGGGAQVRRYRRPKPVARAEELHRRSRQEWRHAVDGGQERLQGRRESRDHAGRGDLPQRAAGADPVHADDAESVEAAAGHHAAADQQILRAGSFARQEHGPLPARERHSGVLRQLAQSDGGASRLGARHLCRGARRSGRRGARDHRQRRYLHDGILLRRHHLDGLFRDARQRGASRRSGTWCWRSACSIRTRPTRAHSAA